MVFAPMAFIGETLFEKQLSQRHGMMEQENSFYKGDWRLVLLVNTLFRSSQRFLFHFLTTLHCISLPSCGRIA